MSDENSNRGRPVLPEDEKRSYQAVTRMTESQRDELFETARKLRLSSSDLMRVGILYLIRDIEDEKINLDRLYRDAHTT